jgi:hypothetical protein
VLKRQRPRPRLHAGDRLFWTALRLWVDNTSDFVKSTSSRNSRPQADSHVTSCYNHLFMLRFLLALFPTLRGPKCTTREQHELIDAGGFASS